jgi:hypothetical protein
MGGRIAVDPVVYPALKKSSPFRANYNSSSNQPMSVCRQAPLSRSPRPSDEAANA